MIRLYEEIKKQAADVTAELCEKAKLHEGQILVVGCSSSEVYGDKIGSNSNLDAARAVFSGIYETTKARGIYLAAQCCEHLNRAIISATAEIQIQVIDGEIGREFSEDIGLNLFKF